MQSALSHIATAAYLKHLSLPSPHLAYLISEQTQVNKSVMGFVLKVLLEVVSSLTQRERSVGNVNSPNKLTADIYTFIYVISVPGGLPRGYA